MWLETVQIVLTLCTVFFMMVTGKGKTDVGGKTE